MKYPRGKQYDPEFKLRLVKEFVETDKTLEEIAQENGISSKGEEVLCGRRKEVLEGTNAFRYLILSFRRGCETIINSCYD